MGTGERNHRDVLAQLRANPDLQPGRAIRDSAIVAIVLVDGQVDHTTGLYMLRESVAHGPFGAPTALCRSHPRQSGCSAWLEFFCGVDRHRHRSRRRRLQRRGVPGIRWRALPVASKTRSLFRQPRLHPSPATTWRW